MKKYLFLILSIIFVFGGINYVKANMGDNVMGTAWSENIGWISFNCKNDFSGTLCANSNYGVDINGSTGDFKGYAWSENIGWISFNQDDVEKGKCCALGCRANYSSSTGLVTGFARVVANNGDGSGCLKLRGTTVGGGPAKPYGVSISSTSGAFAGWAWSDDIVGWVSFSNLNCDSDGDGITDRGAYPQCSIGQRVSKYQVEALFDFNNAPIAGMSCQIESCGGNGCECNGNWVTYNQDNDSTNAIYKIINNSRDMDPGDFIAYSTWTLRNAGGDIVYQDKCNLNCDYTIQSHPAGNYNIELQVEDEKGKSSNLISHSITIKQEAKADFECCLGYSEDPAEWKDCTSTDFLNKMPGTMICFKDNLPAPHLHSVASDGALIVKEEWTINGVTSTGPTSCISLTGSSDEVELKIEDNQVRDAFQGFDFKSLIPAPPVWREVTPVSFVEKIVAFISKVFQV
jgi:hypothetical protein